MQNYLKYFLILFFGFQVTELLPAEKKSGQSTSQGVSSICVIREHDRQPKCLSNCLSERNKRRIFELVQQLHNNNIPRDLWPTVIEYLNVSYTLHKTHTSRFAGNNTNQLVALNDGVLVAFGGHPFLRTNVLVKFHTAPNSYWIRCSSEDCAKDIRDHYYVSALRLKDGRLLAVDKSSSMRIWDSPAKLCTVCLPKDKTNFEDVSSLTQIKNELFIADKHEIKTLDLDKIEDPSQTILILKNIKDICRLNDKLAVLFNETSIVICDPINRIVRGIHLNFLYNGCRDVSLCTIASGQNKAENNPVLAVALHEASSSTSSSSSKNTCHYDCKILLFGNDFDFNKARLLTIAKVDPKCTVHCNRLASLSGGRFASISHEYNPSTNDDIRNRQLIIWDALAGQQLQKIALPDNNSVTAITRIPRNGGLALVAHDGTIMVYEPRTCDRCRTNFLDSLQRRLNATTNAASGRVIR